MRSSAVVNLNAISRNVSRLRELTGTPVMAVVKADGYGHGMVESARAAVRGGAEWLAVAFVEEALTLRKAGIDARILTLIPTADDSLEAAVAHDIDLSVGSLEQLHATPTTARIHLEFDSGLSRGGTDTAGWPALAGAAAHREVTAIWSHFACSEDPDHEANQRQLALYNGALGVAAELGVTPQIRHLANSGATLTNPAARFDLVRPGIAIYGIPPGPRVPMHDLEPAMTLRSTVAATKRVPARTGVSYGLTHTTERETTLALIPLGYGDGIPRHASNTAHVWVNGDRHRIAGRVCMDQLVLDVGDHAVNPGDEAILFGPGTQGEPTAVDWADAIGTIGYEIVTRIGARVPRTYA